MCGGLEFQRPRSMEGSLGLLPEAHEIIRVLFPNPKAALLVDPEREAWLPWGRRKEQPGDWPEGGWARFERLDKAFWTRWNPESLLIHPLRWMEKDPRKVSHWFEMEAGRGLHVLCLRAAPGTPLYVVTVPSADGFKDIHARMPRLVDRI